MSNNIMFEAFPSENENAAFPGQNRPIARSDMPLSLNEMRQNCFFEVQLLHCVYGLARVLSILQGNDDGHVYVVKFAVVPYQVRMSELAMYDCMRQVECQEDHVESEAQYHKCEEGHRFGYFAAFHDDGFVCDSCSSEILCGDPCLGCDPCELYLCKLCRIPGH